MVPASLTAPNLQISPLPQLASAEVTTVAIASPPPSGVIARYTLLVERLIFSNFLSV